MQTTWKDTLIVVLILLLGVFIFWMGSLTGCRALAPDVTQHAAAPGDASQAATQTQLPTQTGVVNTANQATAGGDVSNFDRWALYLVIALPFLAYIIPKTAWHVGRAGLRRLNGGTRDAGGH